MAFVLGPTAPILVDYEPGEDSLRSRSPHEWRGMSAMVFGGLIKSASRQHSRPMRLMLASILVQARVFTEYK